MTRNSRVILPVDSADFKTEKEHKGGDTSPSQLHNTTRESVVSVETGQKYKSRKRQAMKEGKFVGACAPYGYRKAPDDCHRLIVDPVASKVVQQIFQWVAEGLAINAIVLRLNDAGYLPPNLYKKSINEFPDQVQRQYPVAGYWSSLTVRRILDNHVYEGDLIQGKSNTINHKQVKASKEEHIIVRNTHEPIISRTLFDEVQQILGNNGSKAIANKKSYIPNPLKDKLFCGHCGRKLHRGAAERKRTDDVYVLTCLTRYRYDRNGCPGVHIYEHKLLPILVDLLQKELDTMTTALRLSADQVDEKQRVTHFREENQLLMKQRAAFCSRFQEDAQILRDFPERAAEVIGRQIEKVEITHDRHITVFYAYTYQVKAWINDHSNCR